MQNSFSFDDAIRNIVRQENRVIIQKIDSLLANFKDLPEEKAVLNFKEACQYLSCSKSYLYKMTSTNKIPHSKRGKRLFFEKDTLKKWLLAINVKTEDELMFEADSFLNKRGK